jgi:adenylate cyclase
MIGRLRLISGFVLFVFVLGHFSNHALGLVSLELMNDTLAYTVEPWRTLPGTILIVASLTVHAGLAVWALYSRRSLRMKSWELFQLISGFAIPLLLAAHVLSTRGGYEAFGLNEGYKFQLYAQWIATPYRAVMVFAALLLVWIHSCIGWHYWLRYKRWYNRALPIISGLAILIPTLAVAGIISAGFKVTRLAEDEAWVTRLVRKVNNQGDAYVAFILEYEAIIISSVIAIILSVLAIHFGRWVWKQKTSVMKLRYSALELDKPIELKVPRGHTVLEHLRENRISHASVCGGRGRCSTCRIHVEGDPGNLPPLSLEEKNILQRINADPNVRLACQLKVEKDLVVSALLRPNIGSKEALNQSRHKPGEEQEVAILFADIRAFTKMSESQLPYDTAFLLNRYFAAMGKAIEEAGGHLDKFIGDGVMAIFGIDKPLKTGAQEAIMAAKRMSERLEQLNAALLHDIKEPLKIGIGIHSGKAIVGNMGYNKAISLTAIGDVVNTASRLESLNKDLNTQMIVSSKTVQISELDFSDYTAKKVSIRGRADELDVYATVDASKLEVQLKTKLVV